MTVSISVQIDSNNNAAFAEGPATEIGRIMREVAKRIEDGDHPDGIVPIRDVNGNKCGWFSVIDDGEEDGQEE
jgi:hypothetical protein